MADTGNAAVLLGLGKPKGDPKMSEEPMEDEEALEMSSADLAYDEAFDAVKSGDREAFRAAMRSAVEMCMAGED